MKKSIDAAVEMRRIETRDFGADVVRIYAVIMVLTLHFFLRNGFYDREMNDIWGILVMTVRSVSLCCVPLFIVLTGYLKCGKEWNAKYYCSLLPILLSFVLISLIHLPYKIFYGKEERSVAEWILQFFGFKLATYSWYVGMYIGLFLLIPLLNKVWAGCRTQRAHIGVVLTLCAVTFLPAAVNLLITADTNLLPAYFSKMYYISYYFIGCYIRTYKPKVKHWVLWVIIVLVGAGISVSNMLTRTDPADFYTGFSASYDHILTALLTTCTFLSLYQIRCTKYGARWIAAKISNIVFEIYLCSYLPDRIIYASFDHTQPVMMYFPAGIAMVAAVFVISALLAYPVKRISKFLSDRIIRDIFAVRNKKIQKRTEMQT